jgi:hypothetical protein
MSDIFFPSLFFPFCCVSGANTIGDAGCKLVVLEWSMRIPLIACVCVFVSLCNVATVRGDYSCLLVN